MEIAKILDIKGIFDVAKRDFALRILRTLGVKDVIVETAQWKYKRYASPEDAAKDIRYTPARCLELFGEKNQDVVIDFNLLTNGGITEICKLIATTGAIQYDNAHAYLGVGDSTTAEVATQTALQGTNKLFKAMDVGYPQVNGQTILWQSTFTGTEANFAWNEFGVANSSGGTVLLNRKVAAQNTKVSAMTYVLQLSITFS